MNQFTKTVVVLVVLVVAYVIAITVLLCTAN